MDLPEMLAREQLWAAPVERYHEPRRREDVATWLAFLYTMASNRAPSGGVPPASRGATRRC